VNDVELPVVPVTRRDYPDCPYPGDEFGWIIVRDDMPPTPERLAEGHGFMAGPYSQRETAERLILQWCGSISARPQKVRLST
jgi:hypothetical protein